MNTCLKYILGFLLGSWLFTGCHYADMLEFNDIPRVSFVGVDKNGSDTYDPTTLAASLNFGENLKGDSISCDTMTVRIRLLGAPAGQPLKVSLKSVPVGGWPEAEVSFLNPYVIEDSAYRAILKVVVNRPAERHKEYKADLVFDYANSDVAEGIDTLRHYELTITDEVKLNASVSNPYVKNAQVVVMNKLSAPDYDAIELLRTITFAVEAGSAGEAELKAMDITDYTAVQSQSSALMEVAAGTANACVIDITMANAMTGEGTGYPDLAIASELSSEEYGIGFRKDSDMTAKVNEIMDELMADGTLDALSEKYSLTLVK